MPAKKTPRVQRNKRPPKSFTPAKRKAFLASLRRGSSIPEAAASVGVDRTTPHKTLKAEADFARQVELAQLAAIRTVTNALWKRARGGNVTAAIFFLCNRDRDRWQHVNRVELTGKDGGPIRYDEAIRRLDERRAGILGGTGILTDSRNGEPSVS
ncbi:MAG: hypothetical protein LN413_00095 [Candidatus Thermoplasmatota archaeon]|nr:hypothetical protein [Candidatus Thermoplasmatota archaeon]